MAERSPSPDLDDTMLCEGCGTIVQGMSARRHFRKHVARCRGSVELRYGDLVRRIGPPVRLGLGPEWRA